MPSVSALRALTPAFHLCNDDSSAPGRRRPSLFLRFTNNFGKFVKGGGGPVRCDSIEQNLVKISPLDGRYASQVAVLQEYFSEYAFNKYRVRVEIEYFLALVEVLPELGDLKKILGKEIKKNQPKPVTVEDVIRNIWVDFSVGDAVECKKTERITNHDVKAIEYFIKAKFKALSETYNIDLTSYSEFVHFGLTSEDINCTANPLSLQEFIDKIYIPHLERKVLAPLKKLADDTWDVPMLARTHGQAATPTFLGKEIEVFVERLERQAKLLKSTPFSGKFGGATGGFNAHSIAYPRGVPLIDNSLMKSFSDTWPSFADNFYRERLVSSTKSTSTSNIKPLERQQFTTQIEHYDDSAAIFDNCRRINVILVDLSRDIWQYISMNFFKQKLREGEIGSSAMPHKVNPIDFENAEGNLLMANSVYEFLSNKLPISRLQRDLSDSTSRRNYGVPFGHTLISFNSLEKGINKLVLNQQEIVKDLDDNFAVVAEAIQTVLRREGYYQPYEALKKFTRGRGIDASMMGEFVESLDVEERVKKELRGLTPESYARMRQVPGRMFREAGI